MARLHFVKKARKPIKDAGIKKGDSYYWWKFRYGGKFISKNPPKPSQLINSPFLRTIAEIEERIGDLTTADDMESAISDIKDDIESLKDQTQDSLDNMPEGLQQGDTGQMLEARIESLDEMIDELENIDFDVDEDLKGDDREDRLEEILSEINNVEYQGE